jgi:hypothetical protein
MTQAVSHATQNITDSKKPKYCCQSRFSYPFDAKQTLALVFITAMMLMPTLGAAGTAFKATKAAPESGFPSNATCPPLPISQAAIAAYLKFGKAEHYSSNAEKKAAELQDQGYIKSLVDTDYKREIDDKRLTLLIQATRDFRRAGENADHPAASAIAFHQAKDAIMEALLLYKGDANDLKDHLKDLRVQSAEACDEAAQLVEAPEEKLNWVARGLEELQQHVYESASYHKNYDPVSDTAGSLYYTAAQAFKALPSDEQGSHFKIIKREPLEASPTDSRARLAATCLKNAAFYSRFSGNPVVIQALFDKAIAILKSIDAPSLESRADLQEEIVKTCILARNAAGFQVNRPLSARIYAEAMNAQSLYQQLIEAGSRMNIYYTIQRALSLDTAAYYCHDLREGFNLISAAEDLVQDAWDRNPTACHAHPEFQIRSFSPKETLLDRLRMKKELFIEELEKPAIGIWNRVRYWTGL